jgi:uncharacterized spore protein YtfJ
MTEQAGPSGENAGNNYEQRDWAEYSQNVMEQFLAAADIEAVYGEPIEHEENLIIPAAEILSGMGFGFGGGGGYGPPAGDQKEASYGNGGGGGGGGRVLSRPVAVITSTPNGVEVKPVVDVTKIALAALTAWGFMIAAYFRMSSRKRMKRKFKEQAKTLKS